MSSIKIINNSKNPNPIYATEGASGMDVFSNNETEILLQPMERFLVPTGIFMEIPKGFEVQVRPRSGLAYRQGITCLNTPGTIDSDYRGEVKVLLINLSAEPQIIKTGERIAQLVVAKVEYLKIDIVQSLDPTTRGEGGFGHTGKN